MRAIRGATTIHENQAQQIHDKTRELFEQILIQNNIATAEAIVSVLITVTSDINASFPAQAIRGLKQFQLVPVINALEMDVPNSLPFCIRMLVLTNLEGTLDSIQHVYLNEAKILRPDLMKESEL